MIHVMDWVIIESCWVAVTTIDLDTTYLATRWGCYALWSFAVWHQRWLNTEEAVGTVSKLTFQRQSHGTCSTPDKKITLLVHSYQQELAQSKVHHVHQRESQGTSPATDMQQIWPHRNIVYARDAWRLDTSSRLAEAQDSKGTGPKDSPFDYCNAFSSSSVYFDSFQKLR